MQGSFPFPLPTADGAAHALPAASLPAQTRSYVYVLRDHPSLPTTMVTGSHEHSRYVRAPCGPDLALQVSIPGQRLLIPYLYQVRLLSCYGLNVPPKSVL